MKTVRACIYPKDIQRITGRSERYARKLLNDVKLYFGKETHQFITPDEFAQYSGIDSSVIESYIE